MQCDSLLGSQDCKDSHDIYVDDSDQRVLYTPNTIDAAE